jgi:hypothetical protein
MKTHHLQTIPGTGLPGSDRLIVSEMRKDLPEAVA